MGKYADIADFLVRFLQCEVEKTGLKRVVVGLSGGIDSAVVAVLAHRLIVKSQATLREVDPDAIVREILNQVPIGEPANASAGPR